MQGSARATVGVPAGLAGGSPNPDLLAESKRIEADAISALNDQRTQVNAWVHTQLQSADTSNEAEMDAIRAAAAERLYAFATDQLQPALHEATTSFEDHVRAAMASGAMSPEQVSEAMMALHLAREREKKLEEYIRFLRMLVLKIPLTAEQIQALLNNPFMGFGDFLYICNLDWEGRIKPVIEKASAHRQEIIQQFTVPSVDVVSGLPMAPGSAKARSGRGGTGAAAATVPQVIATYSAGSGK